LNRLAIAHPIVGRASGLLLRGARTIALTDVEMTSLVDLRCLDATGDVVAHRQSQFVSAIGRHPVESWLALSTFDTLRIRPKTETQSLAVFTNSGEFPCFLTPACSCQALEMFSLDLSLRFVVRLQLKLNVSRTAMRVLLAY